MLIFLRLLLLNPHPLQLSPPYPPSYTQPKIGLSPIIRKEAFAFAKAKKMSLAEACKKAKIDNTLKRKQALKLEEGVLACNKALSSKERKRKLAEDAMIAALVGKLFEEISDEVILESLKTLSVAEVYRQNAEKATMMNIDGELVFEFVVDLIQARSEQGMKKVEMNELERVQSIAEYATKILSLDVAQRQAEMEYVIVLEDIDPVEKEALKEAMLQTIIEASLTNIIEIDSITEPVRPQPMSNADEKVIDVAQPDIVDADRLKRLEQIYGAPESVSIAIMTEYLD